MIPRTVQMAAEVAAQLTPLQLDNFGNIIINGYATTGPNTTGKLAWQYKETAAAPLPLPSVTSVQPLLRGWTNNYQEYYTQLQPNGYGVNPGDPTMFTYNVHSFVPAIPAVTGIISTTGVVIPGSGYLPGTYTNYSLTGGTGSGAKGTMVVGGATAGGAITGAGPLVAGTGYTAGTYTNISLTGGSGTGAQGTVIATGGAGGGTITGTTFVGGTNYTKGTYLNVSLSGGTGTGARGNMVVNGTGGVTAVSIVTPGTNYGLSGNRVNYSTSAITGIGTGLRVSYNYSAGAITSITGITDGGSGFVVGDTAYVANTFGPYAAGDGIIQVTAATPSAGGPVDFFGLLTGSSGYTVGDVLTPAPGAIPGGTGFQVTVTSVSAGGGGTITGFTLTNPGTGYTAGNVLTAAIPGGGTGWSIGVASVSAGSPGGTVTSFTLTSPGTGYTVGDILTSNLPDGSGWSVPVSGVTSTPAVPGFDPRWGQAPRRFFQNQVADFVPPTANQQAIQYSFIYPVADNLTPPPIGPLT
jgi:hypothetical protein